MAFEVKEDPDPANNDITYQTHVVLTVPFPSDQGNLPDKNKVLLVDTDNKRNWGFISQASLAGIGEYNASQAENLTGAVTSGRIQTEDIADDPDDYVLKIDSLGKMYWGDPASGSISDGSGTLNLPILTPTGVFDELLAQPKEVAKFQIDHGKMGSQMRIHIALEMLDVFQADDTEYFAVGTWQIRVTVIRDIDSSMLMYSKWFYFYFIGGAIELRNLQGRQGSLSTSALINAELQTDIRDYTVYIEAFNDTLPYNIVRWTLSKCELTISPTDSGAIVKLPAKVVSGALSCEKPKGKKDD